MASLIWNVVLQVTVDVYNVIGMAAVEYKIEPEAALLLVKVVEVIFTEFAFVM